jgi:hypothetical protein
MPMPHSEISHLEQLIMRNVLNNDDPAPLKQEDLDAMQECFRAERIKLETQLSQLICSAEDELVINRRIRYYHIRLVKLSNQVYQIIKFTPTQQKNKSLAQIALENIDELMQNAEEIAGNYIDHSIALSHNLVNKWSNNLRDNYAQVKLLLDKHKVNKKLIDVLSTFFAELGQTTAVAVYETELMYAEKLLRGLQKMQASEPADQWTIKLWQLMLYWNFNKKQVLDYSADKVKAVAQGNEPYLVLQEKLQSFLKDVKQMEENHLFSYLKDRISLKTYTIDLIEEELTWLQQHRTSLLAEIANADDNFFIVDFTVRRLNLWAQINVEIGTIPYHNTPHVVRVMSNYVRTLKPGPLSYESARRKLDSYDPTTVKGLHLWLNRQLEHLEKKYGEQLYYEH